LTGAVRVALTLTVFATMLGLVVLRPRRWNEAWWTALGAAAMLALGLVSPREATDATLAGKNALLFLLSLLILSLLVGKSGFFDWAAIWCARFAKGDARSLFRNSFLLGAAVTATLSLDTAAVMLTPVVLALVRRLRFPATPFVVLCAFVANVGSLLLPISNLTNLLFADAFRLRFVTFAAGMFVPQLVALGTTYGLLWWHFRRELPERFDSSSLPAPASVVPSQSYFAVCITVLGVVLVGYFLAPLVGVEPYILAFAGGGVLASAGLITGRQGIRAVGEVPWAIFPFVVGLFVAVRGLENLGIVAASSRWLEHLRPGTPETLLAVSTTTAIASNFLNNLPAALLARDVLMSSHAQTSTILAALVGADCGPLVTPLASLATMLVITLARQGGEDVHMRRLVVFGLWAAPVIVTAATLALVVTFTLVR
jgi:arsenical pump membrane protein